MARSPREKRSEVQAQGACVCGAVRFEIDVPAVWAWHDHGPASRHAQGCAYATYVGRRKSRFRLLAGEDHVTRYEDPDLGTTRSFCARCGTPLFHERARSLGPLKGYPGVMIERPRSKGRTALDTMFE